MTPQQVEGIEAVAMDMWDPYIHSVREHAPEADEKIVFDKFHIAKHLGEAVDQVRRWEHKTLQAVGDDRLKGTRYDWLRNPTTWEPSDRREFAELRKSGLKTARAWALKETAMALFAYVYQGPARKYFRWWHNWAVRSRLKPMAELGRMMKRRFENIITYLRHRVTNAASESTRFIAHLLYKVSPADPWTFCAAAAILTGSVLAACYVPARRAARTNPQSALRRD